MLLLNTIHRVVHGAKPLISGTPEVKMGATFFSVLLFSFFLIPQFTQAQICTNRTVSNTNHCNSSAVYSIWLNNGSGGYHFSTDAANLSWEECTDGTAQFTASGLTASNAPGEVLEVSINFSGYTTTPPSGSPKNNVCGSTNTNGWVYYTETNGTIVSNLHGSYTITRMGPAFQQGFSANQTGVGYGASGWFHMNGGDGYWVKGDVNIMLSNDDDPVCDGQIDDLIFNALSGGSDLIIQDGGTYAMGDLPASFNIEALASGTVESIRFTVSGGLNDGHTENYAPYRYRGDNNALNLTPGTYTVNAKAYSGNHTSGDLCDEQTVTFTIAGDLCTGEISKLEFFALDGSSNQTIQDGGTYDLANLPSPFNIRAKVGGTLESVKFIISGALNDTHTENHAPYHYRGDNNPLNLNPGTYTVTAKAFRENQASGELCDEKTLTFTITNTCTGTLNALQFHDLNGNNHINITNGGSYNLADLPSNFNIEALVGGDAESVRFTISGGLNDGHTENYAPYRYKGDNNALNLAPGNYTLNVKVYQENQASGELCDEQTLHFTIEAAPCTGQITEVVINALSGGSDIVLTDGATLSTGQLPATFNIEALTSGTVESVRFTISGDLNDAHTENYDPYRYKGDNNAMNIGPGTYTVNVKAYQENQASGTLCDERTLTFTIADEICDNITYGGTIGLGAGGFFNEEETCDPCSVPIIQSNAAPSGGSGNLEVVWIKRPMSESLQECQDAFSEMAAYNVGELYDTWVANGSNPNNSQIGNTSWMFVTDGDADDLTLTLGCLEESTCFVRCARREGCTPFSGESNFVRIEVNAGLNGGTIAVAPPQGGDPYLGGAAICAGDAVPVLGTSVFDGGFTGSGPNGELLEFVWLQTSNASDPGGAFNELVGLNVGTLYNTFVQNGMVDPNIYGTSWKFATDNDGNDLTLSLANLDASAAFVRCARVVGDTRFCGESSFASITVEACAPAAPSCTYERCDGVATITGVSASGINLVRILDADQAGLPIVYECGTFLGQQCGDPIVFDLPNPSGSYIVSIVCDDGNHYEYLNETCGGGALVQSDNGNQAQNDRAIAQDNGANTAETTNRNLVNTNTGVDGLKLFPNPAKDKIFINLSDFTGQAALIEIYNNLGQMMLEKQIDTIDAEAVQVDLPTLNGGVYLAKVIINGNEVMTEQFVINLTK